MKKFLSLTIALLFAVCLIQPAASADENSVMLDISSAEAAEGGTASVSFTVSENPGITSFDIALSYDSENLIYQSCSLDGGVFSGTTFQISSGLHAVFMDSAGSSLTGKVFTAVFAFSENAKKGETYTVSASLEKTSFYSGENAVEAVINSGGIKMICKEHTYTDGVTQSPSCADEGYSEQICTVCGHKETSTVQALGHTVSSWTVSKESTCSEPGEQSGICTVCGQTVTEELPVAEHTYGDWEIKKMPTVASLGERAHICAVCGYEETQVMAKLVTGVSDPVNGASIIAQGDLSFFGTSSFTVEQTLYNGLSEEEKAAIDKSISSLVGKRVYSQYELQFVDEDYGKIVFEGMVTVMLPFDGGIDGAVLISCENGEFTIINASFSDSLIQFSASEIADRYFLLCDETQSLTVGNMTDNAAPGAEGSHEAPKGWIIAIIAAAVLLAVSGAMVFIGIRHQKAVQKPDEALQSEFEVDSDNIKADAPENSADESVVSGITEESSDRLPVFRDIAANEFKIDIEGDKQTNAGELLIDDSLFDGSLNRPHDENLQNRAFESSQSADGEGEAISADIYKPEA